MNLFLGIDSGGTHTTGCLATGDGIVVTCATAGLGNPNHASDADLHAHHTQLLNEIFADASLDSSQCVSVFAGVAGVTCESTASRIRNVLAGCGLAHAQIGIDHDIRIALAGGLAGRPGIALIVGTGSSCYGRDAHGNTWQSGGWGALISDEGSGYFIGREAISAAMRMADGRQAETRLKSLVFQWLGIQKTSEILSRIYEQNLTRPEIAGFAPGVVEMADQSDAAALEILQRGAVDLAQMVAANHLSLPTSDNPELVITGGLGTADTCYRPLIENEICRVLPSVRIREPRLNPTAGATLLAIEQYNGPATPTIISNLKSRS